MMLKLPNLTSRKLPVSKYLWVSSLSITPLPKVEIKTEGWPLWAGIVLGFGVSLVAGTTGLVLIKYRKFLMYPSCLAIRAGRDLGQIEAQNGRRRSVSVQSSPTSMNGGHHTHNL